MPRGRQSIVEEHVAIVGLYCPRQPLSLELRSREPCLRRGGGGGEATTAGEEEAEKWDPFHRQNWKERKIEMEMGEIQLQRRSRKCMFMLEREEVQFLLDQFGPMGNYNRQILKSDTLRDY